MFTVAISSLDSEEKIDPIHERTHSTFLFRKEENDKFSRQKSSHLTRLLYTSVIVLPFFPIDMVLVVSYSAGIARQ